MLRVVLLFGFFRLSDRRVYSSRRESSVLLSVCMLVATNSIFFFWNLFLQDKTGFDENSSFIDVGSGLGKPNFHVAHDPKVEISYGLELEKVRWELSITNHRR